MNHAISMNRVTKAFKRKVAVDNVSFNIPWGEFCCIAGENGAGKSTLAKMLIGAIKPSKDSGEILIGDKNIRALKPQDKQIFSYQPQNIYSLFMGLTVYEVIYNVALLKKISDVKARVDEQIHQFKLSELKDSLVSYLSGGERQLLALCLTFLGNAPILIFDEPTNNLDFEKKQIFFRALENYKKASSKNTILMISHDCGIFENIIDSILILHNAKTVYNGSTKELCNYLDKKVKISLKPNINTSQDEMICFLKEHEYRIESGNIIAFVNDDELHNLLMAYTTHIEKFILDVSKISLDDKIKEVLYAN